MKMKKFLAVCLSALTVTGMLAGCGGAKGGDTSSAGAEKKEAVQKDLYIT